MLFLGEGPASSSGGVKIDGNDKVLTLSDDGLLTNLNLTHDTTTVILTLSGRNDDTGNPYAIASVNLPLDQVLESASYDAN
jgi:hypothetical protein